MENNYSKDRKSRRKATPEINTMVYGKVAPQARELEEAILGALMLEPHCFDIVDDILKPECYYSDANQRIYRAIQTLQRDHKPADILMVVEQLRTTDELELVGGPYYVTKLTNSVISSANVEHHCRIVLRKYLAREMIKMCGEAITACYEDGADIYEAIEDHGAKINSISMSSSRDSYRQVDEAMIDELKALEKERNREHTITGVPTGFKEIDSITTGGWQPGDLILLAARPSCGKTAFSINLALNAAKNPFKPTGVAFFSLEMRTSKIIQRMLAATSGIPLSLIKSADLTDADMARLQKDGVQPFINVPLWIDNTPAMTLPELRAKSRNLKKKFDIGMVIIDYLQLMRTSEGGSGKFQNREREVAEISAGIKALALNLQVPIIALSQLSRDIEKRTNGKFRLSDLRDSGSLEQDADVVMFIHKPDAEEVQQDSRLMDTASIIFAKNRDGALGEKALRFHGATQKWSDFDADPFTPKPATVSPRDFTVPNRLESGEPFTSDNDDNPF